MTNDGPNISIIGAGIGGLAAAVALRRAGMCVEVFEQSQRFDPVGAGMVLAPNGMDVLHELGLDREVSARSSEISRVQIRDTRGTVLQRMNFGGKSQADARPALGILRANLHEALLRAVPAEIVHNGRQLVTLWDSGESVRLYFADGAQQQTDVLIGADGLESTVRAAMHGASPPRYAGYIAWRGVCQGDFTWMRDAQALEIWSRGVRFGAAPVGSGQTYWWLAANRPADSPRPNGSDLAEALAECKYWEGPAAEMIAATPEEEILRHEVFDRPPIREWSRGRVTLLGDAAHVMTPNLGQGANQALEDALVLSQMLREVSSVADVKEALRGYQDDRAKKANRMVRQSRLAGRVGQMSWPPAVWARDKTARIMPSAIGKWWYGSLSKTRVRS